MQIVFHPDAREELNRAISHYEDSERRLGYQFAVEIFAAVERIKINPNLWPMLDYEVRRCLVHRFPYGVIYFVDEKRSTVLILAVMHLHRQPGYWSDRA
ncbi:type II toxin-antitoxin system RelE/ParE family toxin [Cyanobium sp. WAJ14-Wanaka]|uniref:type II toxin-antitoxin system RelE/ParE family toxin n=1 Tax=Cyanobium sp. WAJ14-Wanaka TaxID=2823725 RepID=UPI0020CEAE58|nr:type II toxin-antitoxin system RelE/ParE family toxin [Cyanobium sp. WAJ14-Wanaka]MCP9775108.1 type II toxin-antitoxin system RelE/ParE family toxin [Cyanobium sp. WAJ14-Wanaka]